MEVSFDVLDRDDGDNEGNQGSVFWPLLLAIVLGSIALSVTPWSVERTELLPRGMATVTDSWGSIVHFVKGSSAEWRNILYKDGATEEGAIKHGNRSGKWKRTLKGKSTFITYKEMSRDEAR